jgi:hypothetical protein
MQKVQAVRTLQTEYIIIASYSAVIGPTALPVMN